MKIEARTADGSYLVSMTEREIANVAGYHESYHVPGEFHVNGVHSAMRLGVVFSVTDTFVKARGLFEQEKKVRDHAGMLRTLADMIEGVGPTELLPPEPQQATES